MKYSFDAIFEGVGITIDFDSNWSNEVATPKWASMEGYLHNASVGQYSPLLVKNQVVKSVSPSGLRVLIIGIDSSLDPEIAGNFVLYEQYLGMLGNQYEFRDKHTLVYNAPSSFSLENGQQPSSGMVNHDMFDDIIETFFPNIAREYNHSLDDDHNYKALFKEAIFHLRGVVGSRNSFSSQANELLFSSSEPLALRQPEVEAIQLAAFRFCNNHDDGSEVKLSVKPVKLDTAIFGVVANEDYVINSTDAVVKNMNWERSMTDQGARWENKIVTYFIDKQEAIAFYTLLCVDTKSGAMKNWA